MLRSIFLFILISPLLFSQEKTDQNVWQPLQYFVGEWEGHSTGKSREGNGGRVYKFIMNDMFLYYQNTMKFDPQEKNPKGDFHEDRTFYSYDKNRNLIVVRQFNIEGFINQFVLDSLSSDQKTLIFITESSENAPPGLKARLIYEIENENEFVETFELGFTGKEFSCWMINHWKRKVE
ncbi:MAG: hypothetical protein JSW07_20030 [bacterium]|nr:MAG: hypothetical protein JSW07_20030 [bacterium]